MAGTTYRELVFDMEKVLKQNFADAEINTNAILFWITVAASRLRRARFKNDLKESDSIEGAYLSIFDEIPIKTFPTSNNPNKLKGLKYIEFPYKIVDLEFDKGIDYITYSDLDPNCCYGPGMTRIVFTKTMPSETRRLYMRETEKPTEKNPYYYRTTGSIIYLLGLEESNISKLQIGCFLNTTFDDVRDTKQNPDASLMVIDLPEDLISVLRYELMNMGRAILMMPRDRKNDGTDNTPTDITAASRVQQIQQPQSDGQ